jgi:phosphoenolpyruvate carboxykinase (ATP)
MKLKYTRAMITATLNGELDAVEYKYHAVLDLLYLNLSWCSWWYLKSKQNMEWCNSIWPKAVELAQKFKANKFEEFANSETGAQSIS